MQTKAVRLYGKNDLRLDTFTLRPIGDDEIQAKVVTDSACMSTYKGIIQGNEHKRIPEDIAVNPIVTGHEFAGVIEQVGKNLSSQYHVGQMFTLQPNINYKGIGYAPGYSFTDFGGNASHIVIPGVVMEQGFLLPYQGDAFYKASLGEPLSCIISALKSAYHTGKDQKTHVMGIRKDGAFALLAGCGAMGLGTVDILINSETKPSLIVVTDIDDARLDAARRVLPEDQAKKKGVTLRYINTGAMEDPAKELIALNGGKGYDDIMVMAPVKGVLEQADKIAGKDCCINFFSGPTDKAFSAMVNFYDVHYSGKHIIGTSGGDTEDMRTALKMIEETDLNPAVMVTHVGGLNCVPEMLVNFTKIPGGKKLTYSNKMLPLTAIKDFAEAGKTDPFFAKLDEICSRHGMLWNPEAERYLLENARDI
jgi:threonine dehydrogenase-like Zn-dependent dehydrogenase